TFTYSSEGRECWQQHSLTRPRVVNVATMRMRILTAVAIIGGLALVAVAILVFWFAGGAMGGGTTSVGQTSVQYVSISPDRRISLVIWSDSLGAAETSGDSDLFGSSAEGFFSSVDGKRIDWKWKAPKEKGGDFQLNGTPYDLANDTRLPVSTTGGQVRVTQLDVDLSRVRPNAQAFEALAKNEPTIAKFIAEASGQK